MTTWINLEGKVLSEISQTERQMLHGITYLWDLKKKVKLIETESRMVVARSLGWGKWRHID